MRSQTRRAAVGSTTSRLEQQQEVMGVEVDGTFGRLVGLREGMKVRLILVADFVVVVGLVLILWRCG